MHARASDPVPYGLDLQLYSATGMWSKTFIIYETEYVSCHKVLILKHNNILLKSIGEL